MLTRYEPRTSLSHAFRTFFDDDFWNMKPGRSIVDNPKEVVVQLDVPGFEKENLSITYNNQYLTIYGELKNEYTTREINKSYHIGTSVDIDNAKAELNNGLLKVVLPKTKEAIGREIPIS